MSGNDYYVSIFESLGEYAEDKDFAKDIRVGFIIPALEKKKDVCLDFLDVRFTTQSFIHACISESVRKFGNLALSLIEFKDCSESVKSIILTVIGYSLQFSMEIAKKGERILSKDIPQADSLYKIRDVIGYVSMNIKSVEDISRGTGYTERHVRYRLDAARILGLIYEHSNGLSLTASGHELLKHPVDSTEEKDIYKELIINTKLFQVVSPDLFDETAPSVNVLMDRIISLSNISRETAKRRAQTLHSWRRQVSDSQLEFKF